MVKPTRHRIYLRTVMTLLCAAVSFSVTAQRIVKGTVVDSISGAPVAYANIFVKGTQSGTVADDRGVFNVRLSSRPDSVVVSSYGYNPKRVATSALTGRGAKIKLSPSNTTLAEVVVKKKSPKYRKKGNPAVELMERIRHSAELTDPHNADFYTYDEYEKVTIALNDFNTGSDGSWMNRNMKYLNDFVETSETTGKTILPVSVREKTARNLWRAKPGADKQVVTAMRQSGFEELVDATNLNTFTADLFREIDIYDNDITMLQNRFVSPLSRIGGDYYKYFITDTVRFEGVPHVELSFTPHTRESFGFNGRMYVDISDSIPFVSKIVMNSPPGLNVNYVKNIYMVQDFVRDASGHRHKVSDDMTVEFEIIPGTQGLYARRQSHYSGFSDTISAPYAEYYEREGHTHIAPGADRHSDIYWATFTQTATGQDSNGVAQMIERLNAHKWFRLSIAALKLLVTGYIHTGKPSKVDIGPVNTMISSNTVEGIRLRLGGMTTGALSKHIFARGFGAYGTRDHKWKYHGELEYSFTEQKKHSREFPIHSIKLEHGYDLDHLGQHYLFTNPDNFFLSFKRQPDDKVNYLRTSKLTYTLERRSGFSIETGLTYKQREATRWLPFENGYGDVMRHYYTATAFVTLRYAPGGETFYQMASQRLPINMDTPVFQITHEYGPRRMFGSLSTINKTEASVFKRIWFSAFGYADVVIKAGKVWSQVQYPDLPWANANLSYTIQPEGFPLMNAMEFATDQYATWDVTYWMNGLIFNRLPLIKKLKLREVVSFRGLYGSLTDKNNPALHNSLFRFPYDAYSSPLHGKPYMEIGVGLDNILTFLRLDYVWRLTYRDTPGADRSGLRLALHFTF